MAFRVFTQPRSEVDISIKSDSRLSNRYPDTARNAFDTRTTHSA